MKQTSRKLIFICNCSCFRISTNSSQIKRKHFLKTGLTFKKWCRLTGNIASQKTDVEVIFDFLDFAVKKIPAQKVTNKWKANKTEIKEGFILQVPVRKLIFHLQHFCFNVSILI